MNRELVLAILGQTILGTINWTNEEGQTCISGTFEDEVYIVSKYSLPHRDEISFNVCDEYNFIVKPFMEYSENHELFDIMSKIYDIGYESTKQTES